MISLIFSPLMSDGEKYEEWRFFKEQKEKDVAATEMPSKEVMAATLCPIIG